jgi:hypothetical protein
MRFRSIGEVCQDVMQRVDDQRSGPGQAPRAQLRDFAENDGSRREEEGRTTMGPAVEARFGAAPLPVGGDTGNLVLFRPMVAVYRRRNERHTAASAAIIDLSIYRIGGRHGRASV